ncbi:EF hand [Pseudobythopirellula maris]|uniref:EF hand n=1 Tax=Pseudobythopirellula maris TaxID=2527991 RepID=A0A5C5ZSS9_9BACT|nr:hypothetical protein [Pseudobythopirellula maris]TWT90592.1 EF hand [Pseudobythopirellula maris]
MKKFSLYRLLGLLVLAAFVAAPVDAQPPGRGGPRGGGDGEQSQQDDGPRGPRGRGGRPSWGGPPGGGDDADRGERRRRGGDNGGERGGRGRGGDREGRGGRGGPGGGFLSRFDKNGDGNLSPDEVQGRMQRMVEGAALSAGLKPGQPWPIAKLEAAMSAERERREAERDEARAAVQEWREGAEPMAFAPPEGPPTVAAFGEEPTTTNNARPAAARDQDRNQDRGDDGRGNERERGRFSRRRGSDEQADRGGNRSDSQASTASRSYRFLSPAERLPQGAPAWFTQKDRDGDGQVAMHEYARSWSDREVDRFYAYDKNSDGVIDAAEVASDSSRR